MNNFANKSLLGYSGFVGSSLKRQTAFRYEYRSSDAHESLKIHHDLVVCAAAPGEKWRANRYPESDKNNLSSLKAVLSQLKCETFILISTVDVFKHPNGVNEDSIVDTEDLHPYGLHRRELEVFVDEHFERSLIVRLPGLVGPGLKKNIIFDIHNKRVIDNIDASAMYQFYPTVNLWFDIASALEFGVKLVHLTAEPISVEELAKEGFGRSFEQSSPSGSISYDLQSKYARLFGGNGNYQYSKSESIQAIRAFAQTEPRVSRL